MTYAVVSSTNQAALIKKLLRLKYPKKYPETKVAFGHVFGVWADFALEELKAKAGPLFKLLSPEMRASVHKHLVEEMSLHGAPTLASRIHMAADSWQLKGKTPRSRYLYFVETIVPEPGFLKDLFSEFPAFYRTISTLILLFVEQFHDFLRRLSRDRKELQTQFGIKGKVKNLTLSLSDFHNGNRSVYKIEFENGVLLVYKPKTVRIEKAYNTFLEGLARLGLSPRLKTFSVLDKGEYGWVEFVHSVNCKTQAEVERYFEKFGMLIALMHILRSTDFHSENMLASGEDPLLIDLETLLHPDLPFKNPASKQWNYSVLRTHFLPTGGKGMFDRGDSSPLSGQEEELLRVQRASWQDVNTDKMEFIYKNRVAKRPMPRPKVDGCLTSSREYIKELARGFTKMYELVSSHKKEVGALMTPLFECPVRPLLRSTALYAKLLRRLSDPELMQSEKQTEECMKVLTRAFPVKTGLKEVIAVEKQALKHLDIPFFRSMPSDSHLYVGQNIIVKDFFVIPAKEQVLQQLENLNREDLEKQLSYIEQSLYFLKREEEKTPSRASLSKNTSLLTPQDFIQTAEEIGEKVLSSAASLSDGTISWISLEYDPRMEKHLFQPLTNDFYSGEAGIALFLAALKQPKFVKRAEEIFNRLKAPFYEDAEMALRCTALSGMTDAGGIIYALNAAGKILNHQEYLKDALYLASLIQEEQILQDTAYDLIKGSAGLILVLLSLYEKSGEPSLLKTAQIAADHIQKSAQPMAQGCAWGDRKLCGLSHGNAGIAYALFKLGAVANTRAYQKTAIQALQYERSCFSKTEGGWPDLRSFKTSYKSCSWCSGAAGIGLSRVYASRYHTDEEMEQEIQVAKKLTLAQAPSSIDHLCCGNFGLIALHYALDPSSKDAWKLSSQLVHRYKETGSFQLYHDLPPHIQNPGFMRGLAGIGYVLLQMGDPARALPQPLVLE